MEAGEEKEDKQPDIIVKMPSKKDLVVDSKVNLTAYSEYFNTSDDAARAGAAASPSRPRAPRRRTRDPNSPPTGRRSPRRRRRAPGGAIVAALRPDRTAAPRGATGLSSVGTDVAWLRPGRHRAAAPSDNVLLPLAGHVASLRPDRTVLRMAGGVRGTPCRRACRPTFDGAATQPRRPWRRRLLRLRRLPPRAGPSPRAPVLPREIPCHGRRAGQPTPGGRTLIGHSERDRGRRRGTTSTRTSVASLRPGDRHHRTG